METIKVNVKLEYRPLLQMCSFTFALDTETRITTAIQKSSIAISPEGTGSCVMLKLDGKYSVDVASVKVWNPITEWTYDESTEVCSSTDITRTGTIRWRWASQPDAGSPARSVEVLPENASFELRCKECESRLTEEGWEYQRVLPLPSENWQSLQDMWFCHKHEQPPEDNGQSADSVERPRNETTGTTTDLKSKLLSTGLEPRVNDMYYSNTKVLVHAMSVPTSWMTNVDGSSVVCRGCQGVVGQRDSEKSIYFYRMKVDLFDANTHRIINSRTPLNLLAKLIREQIAHDGIHCRLVLTSESSGDALLIWMLDSDLLKFEKEFNVAKSKRIDLTVTFEPCHQVLFQSTKRNAPIVQEWCSELTVPCESVLQSTLDVLNEHLREASFAEDKTEDSFDSSFDVACIPVM